MTNKDYKRRKVSRQAENKQKVSTEQKKQNLNKIVSIVIVVVVVATVGGLFGFHVIKFPSVGNSKPSFSAPTSTPWGSGEQISDSSFGSNIHIYYISWYGCPFGATDSWAFFLALNSYLGTNLSNHGWTTLHTSVAGDVYGSTPGLLFSGFSYKNVVFQPVYVYNQTMKGTTSNVSISPSHLVSKGLSEINNTIPAVSSLEYKYLYQLPIYGKTVSSFLQFSTPHVNTNIIITGPNGAWLFNGPIYNSSTLRKISSSTPYTPQYVMDHQKIIDTTAVNSVLNAIKAVA